MASVIPVHLAPSRISRLEKNYPRYFTLFLLSTYLLCKYAHYVYLSPTKLIWLFRKVHLKKINFNKYFTFYDDFLFQLYDSCYWGSRGMVNSASDYGSTEELGAIGGAGSDSAIELGLSSSNYLDGISSDTLNNINGRYSDITSLLASLSLEKYDRAFKSHEIDLNSFKTLSEDDLKEIGVSALGARRKLLIAIAGELSVYIPLCNLRGFLIEYKEQLSV